MNCPKYTNNIPALLLFVVLYETTYYQHIYFWYFRPSIIDQFTLIICVFCRHVGVGGESRQTDQRDLPV